MIEYLIGGAIGCVIGAFGVWALMDSDKRSDADEAVANARAQWVAEQQVATQTLQDEYADQRDNAAKHFATEIKGLHDTLANERQAHVIEITTLTENFAQQLEAAKAKAYQDGKESDGVIRNAKGQMQSVKKAATKAPVKRTVKNVKASTPKKCG